MKQRYIILATLLSLIAIVVSYLFIDQKVAQWAFSLGYDTTYNIAMFIGHFAEAQYPLGIALFLWLWFKFYKKALHRAYSALFFIVTVVVVGLGVNLLKVIFGKARPLMLKNEGEFGFTWFVSPKAYDYLSFPSGHTTVAFSVATLLALYFPRYWVLFYGYATLIAISRVLCWFHYVSDVIAAGLYASLATYLIFKKFYKGHP